MKKIVDNTDTIRNCTVENHKCTSRTNTRVRIRRDVADNGKCPVQTVAFRYHGRTENYAHRFNTHQKSFEY